MAEVRDDEGVDLARRGRRRDGLEGLGVANGLVVRLVDARGRECITTLVWSVGRDVDSPRAGLWEP